MAKSFSVPHEKLILASGSPRRSELLAEMGVVFEVITADVEEFASLAPGHPTPSDLAMANAHAKASAVAKIPQASQCWVLGADTVVALEDRLFGKPSSSEQAREFLQALSGQTHEVITGCALINRDGREQSFHEVSHVTFKILTEDVIKRYLAEVHVLDKAGAYALQEHGDWIIERVEGSHDNVIGLPTELIEKVFKSVRLL